MAEGKRPSAPAKKHPEPVAVRIEKNDDRNRRQHKNVVDPEDVAPMPED